MGKLQNDVSSKTANKILQLVLCRVAALKTFIVQILFLFRAFEINKDIQSVQNTRV